MFDMEEEKAWLKSVLDRRSSSENHSHKMKSEPTTAAKDTVREPKEVHGFADVAGMEELKTLFQESFINLLKNQECAKAYNLTPPGILLYGAPGVGKTYIAHAVAAELGISFMQVTPDSVASPYMHGSTQKIAKIFQQAEEKSPTILFLDEVDCLIPKRTTQDRTNQNDEVDEFLCKLSTAAQKQVYVIAATNDPGSLDRAALRSGRFDELIYVDMPDCKARKSLLQYCLSKLPAEANIDYDKLASISEGFNCSDISYVVEVAARKAFNATIKEKCKPYKLISQQLLEEAVSHKSPSVSEKDLKKYERIRSELSPKDARVRIQRIGFK